MNNNFILSRWIAYMLPTEIAYWCAVRVLVETARTTSGARNVQEILLDDVLSAWKKENPL